MESIVNSGPILPGEFIHTLTYKNEKTDKVIEYKITELDYNNPDALDKSQIIENEFKEFKDYTPFDQLSTTLMTFIVNINGSMNKEAIYETYPVQKVSIDQKRKKKKIKIPHFPEHVSKCISMGFGNSCRGVFRKPFKNNASSVMCLKEKNISIKFFDDILQLTGAKSLSHVNECLYYLTKDLNDIQDELDHIQNDKEKAEKTLKWIADNLSGPNDMLNQLPEIADSPDERIATFLLSYYSEFNRWSDYQVVLKWILETPRVISTDFSFKFCTLVMTNYNFDLGFEVNRNELVKQILLKTKFVPHYNNEVNYAVNIRLPYRRDERFRMIRKKKKEDYDFSYQIYKSGRITFSGPNPTLMRGVYDYFQGFINNTRYLIDNKKPTVEISEEIRNLQIENNSEKVETNSDETESTENSSNGESDIEEDD